MHTSDGIVRVTAGQRLGGGPGTGAESVLCWPDLVFARERVIALGAPAQRWTASGELWEFEDDAFFVTRSGDGGRRRQVDDEERAPAAGWTHRSDCGCAACRVAVL